MKKICFVQNSLGFGGVESVTVNLANYYVQNGYDVTILCLKSKTEMLEKLDSKCNVIFSSAGKIYLNIPFLWKHFFKNKYDAVISSIDFINVMSVIAYKLSLSKAPLLLVSHTKLSAFYASTKWKYARFSIKLARYVYPFADVIASVSQASAKDLKQFLELKKDVDVLYNPVIKQQDLSYIPLKKPHSAFDLNKKIIISCGRLEEEKNHHLFLNSLKVLKDKKVDFHALILGDGSLKQEVIQQIDDLGLALDVSLTGFVNNVVDYLYYADMLALHSNYEGLPTVLIEGLAQECNLISTDCTDAIREIIPNHKVGLIVEKNNAAELAKALEVSLLKDSSQEKLKQHVSKFLVKDCAEKYLEVLGLCEK